MPKHLLVCDCAGSMSPDLAALSHGAKMSCSRLHTALCTKEMDVARAAIEQGNVAIACTQEQPRFTALAESLGAPEPLCVDIRDRAGWGTGDPGPKMAALLREAVIAKPAVRTIDVESAGQCLVIGAGDVAFAAAEQLCETLTVTLLQTDRLDPPLDRRFEVVRGKVTHAAGAMGGFSLGFDHLQLLDPTGRGGFAFTPPRNGAKSTTDLIVDLSGDTALVPAPHKREGYWHLDPANPIATNLALIEVASAVGVFEQPVYLAIEEQLCAHSRANQKGCSKCLDACPTGAITSAGDFVSVDPMVCAGCGACSALCPSGAITYDAPPVADIFQRIETLGRVYREAGGHNARLLIHDDHGAELIAYGARYFDGLPGHVIPLHLPSLPLMGHAEMLAALATGFDAVDILLSRGSDRSTLEAEMQLANCISAAPRVGLLDIADPEVLCTHFAGNTAPPNPATAILPMGGRRQVARLAGQALQDEITPLPAGAPYGTVEVDQNACTLCLACVSLCPSGALLDNPDRPQLRFQEDACLQCGICSSTCPESAITLRPRFNPTDGALAQVVLNEEEPFCCVECDKPFGVKSTVERIHATLAGKHPMFADGPAARMIKMCDDCRVNAQYHSENTPLGGAPRRHPKTSGDYLAARSTKQFEH